MATSEPVMQLGCPSCSKTFGVAPGTQPGTQLACPHCQALVSVPGVPAPTGAPMVVHVKPQTEGAPPSQSMSDCPAILIKQRLQAIEILCPACEKKNKYKIAALHDKDRMQNSWSTDVWDDSPQILVAKEDSDVMCRICCQKWREFTMDIKDANTDEKRYEYFRPFKTNMTLAMNPYCCWWGACWICLQPQEIQAKDGEGNKIGRVEHDMRCANWFCCCASCHWKAYDENDKLQYVFKDRCCDGCNCCAPSPCVEVHTIDIMDPEEKETLGTINNYFPGCNLKACAATSHYKMEFPPDATEKQRGLLLGGLMLIEFMLFEKEDQNN